MNAFHPRRTLAAVLATAATGSLLALLAAAPQAQDVVPQAQDESRIQQDLRRRSQVAEPQEPEFLRQNPVISIEFEGGSVQEYVAVLRRAAPNVNIMLDSDAGDVDVPAFELRGVMLIDALKILEDLEPEDQSYELSLDHFASGPSEFYAPVFRVTAIKQRPPQPPLQTSVWSVRQLLSNQIEAAHILGAIETALSLQEDLGAPEVRFHEETGLILARAHPEQIAVIAEVIHNLQSSVSPPRDNDLDQMSMRLGHAVAALEEANRRALTSEAESLELTRENERLKTRLEMLMLEVQRVRNPGQ